MEDNEKQSILLFGLEGLMSLRQSLLMPSLNELPILPQALKGNKHF